MLVSECCGAIVYDDYDLCSECLEHCDVWDDEEEDEVEEDNNAQPAETSSSMNVYLDAIRKTDKN